MWVELLNDYSTIRYCPPIKIMAYPLQERYINLLTDFGFKRVFRSEPNKQLLIDFLNTLLPERHRIQSLSYKSTENLGDTQIDRKAIFDIYCQGENGDGLSGDSEGEAQFFQR